MIHVLILMALFKVREFAEPAEQLPPDVRTFLGHRTVIRTAIVRTESRRTQLLIKNVLFLSLL